MRKPSPNSILIALALLAIPCVSYAQYGAGKALPRMAISLQREA